MWPTEPSKLAEVEADFLPGRPDVGDRRQELVFIGINVSAFFCAYSCICGCEQCTCRRACKPLCKAGTAGMQQGGESNGVQLRRGCADYLLTCHHHHHNIIIIIIIINNNISPPTCYGHSAHTRAALPTRASGQIVTCRALILQTPSSSHTTILYMPCVHRRMRSSTAWPWPRRFRPACVRRLRHRPCVSSSSSSSSSSSREVAARQLRTRSGHGHP